MSIGFELQHKILQKFIVLGNYTKSNVNDLRNYTDFTVVTEF